MTDSDRAVFPALASTMGAARREEAVLRRVFQDRQHGAVLDRAGGVVSLDLAQHPGRLRPRQPLQLDQRRVADQRQDAGASHSLASS